MKKRKHKKTLKHEKLLIVLLAVLLVLIVFNYVLYILPYFEQSEIKDLEDFERVRVEVESQTIFLIKDCTALPVIISSEQTYSILKGVIDVRDFRPSTHDLIESIMQASGVEVLAVKVTDLRNGTFYAELVLKQRGRVFSVDSRPSDAIAIAVRLNALIYVKKDLLLKYGEDICISPSEPRTEF